MQETHSTVLALLDVREQKAKVHQHNRCVSRTFKRPI